MDQDLIPVYFMPGMAANPSIFENIKLPESVFESHWLEWEIPQENETIEHYAKRLCEKIQHENPVLIGVSFGGIMVQEMSKQIKTRKVVVISSVKSKNELPNRMKLAKLTKAYKLIPAHLMEDVDKLAKYAFGKLATKRVELYKKYLSMNDRRYLEWAIKQVVLWKQEQPLENVVHIHGDKDGVFPSRHLSNYIKVKDGTHIMIINKYKWFNENLPSIILT